MCPYHPCVPQANILIGPVVVSTQDFALEYPGTGAEAGLRGGILLSSFFFLLLRSDAAAQLRCKTFPSLKYGDPNSE